MNTSGLCISDVPTGVFIIIVTDGVTFKGNVIKNYGSSIAIGNSESVVCISNNRIDRFEIHGKQNVDFFRVNIGVNNAKFTQFLGAIKSLDQ